MFREGKKLFFTWDFLKMAQMVGEIDINPN